MEIRRRNGGDATVNPDRPGLLAELLFFRTKSGFGIISNSAYNLTVGMTCIADERQIFAFSPGHRQRPEPAINLAFVMALREPSEETFSHVLSPGPLGNT